MPTTEEEQTVVLKEEELDAMDIDTEPATLETTQSHKEETAPSHEEETAPSHEETTPSHEETIQSHEKTAQPHEEETAQSHKEETVNISNATGCPHLEGIPGIVLDAKCIVYKSEFNACLCDICSTENATFLNMNDNYYTEACRSCLSKDIEDEKHYPIQLELATGDLYCFKCKGSDGNSPCKLTEEHDGELVNIIINHIKAPESNEDLDKRRKTEHLLYNQELRREDMELKYYLIEKQWSRTWMLFRTREGSPLPGRISNNKLARSNGTLDPNIRLPMDKFRPSPETHGDTISEKLWSYLSKAYGVQGKAYNEDDIIAPEYARLRVYVDDFKKSVDLYR